MEKISEGTTIARNTSILVATEVVTRILGIALTVAIARKLGSANLGLLAFALSFNELFSFLPRFGFKNLITRDVAKEPNKTGSYFGNIFVIKIILSASTLFLIISVLHVMQYAQEKILVVYIAAFVMLLDSYIEFLAAFFRAHQKVKYEAMVHLVRNFLMVSTGLLILFLGYGLVPLISVRLLVYLFSLALGLSFMFKKLSKPSFDIQPHYCIRLIRSSSSFVLMDILTKMNAQIGIVLLSIMRGDVITGWFSAALRLRGVFSFIPGGFVGAVLPAMSKFSQQNSHENLVKTHERTVKYLLIIALPISMGISILADRFILILYGEEYIHSIIALRILIWSLVFSFLNQIFSTALISIGKEKKIVTIRAIGTIFYFCANIVSIPLFGHVGISVVSVLSQMITLAFLVYILSKDFCIAGISKISIKPLLGTLVMGFFLLLLREQNIVFLIPLSAVIYFFTLFSLKTFNSQEVSVLRHIFTREATIFENK